MSIKISSFINDPWRAVALDAERRGIETMDKHEIRLDGAGVMIVGLCDVIREMQERIEKLEGIK